MPSTPEGSNPSLPTVLEVIPPREIVDWEVRLPTVKRSVYTDPLMLDPSP